VNKALIASIVKVRVGDPVLEVDWRSKEVSILKKLLISKLWKRDSFRWRDKTSHNTKYSIFQHPGCTGKRQKKTKMISSSRFECSTLMTPNNVAEKTVSFLKKAGKNN
jgi:hypothetical protein